VPRIPFADPEALHPDARAAFEGARVDAMRVVANASDTIVPWQEAVKGIRNSPDLDPVLRELVILRAAASVGSEYELVQHEAISRDLGVPEAQLAAMRAGEPIEGREGLLVSLVDDLFHGRSPGDERYEAVLAAVSPRALVEAIMVFGVYTTIARVIEAAALEPEPAAGATALDRGRA
jgi:alkylhydroperoxidase family enzyme